MDAIEKAKRMAERTQAKADAAPGDDGARQVAAYYARWLAKLESDPVAAKEAQAVYERNMARHAAGRWANRDSGMICMALAGRG